jgi:hypothetical protein
MGSLLGTMSFTVERRSLHAPPGPVSVTVVSSTGYEDVLSVVVGDFHLDGHMLYRAHIQVIGSGAVHWPMPGDDVPVLQLRVDNADGVPIGTFSVMLSPLQKYLYYPSRPFLRDGMDFVDLFCYLIADSLPPDVYVYPWSSTGLESFISWEIFSFEPCSLYPPYNYRCRVRFIPLEGFPWPVNLMYVTFGVNFPSIRVTAGWGMYVLRSDIPANIKGEKLEAFQMAPIGSLQLPPDI